MIPESKRYWLRNACVPVCLLQSPLTEATTSPVANLLDRCYYTPDNLLLLDIEIADGLVSTLAPAGLAPTEMPEVDLRHGMVWSCFVDMHTHLDKGQIWHRSDNPDGSFTNALEVVRTDSEQYWNAEDVYRRMEFGLKCSYAHGTQAVRTHIDSWGEQASISLEVFKTLQTQWADRLILQAASLVSLEHFLTAAGEKLADQMAAVGGLLGGFAQMQPELAKTLDRIFALAQERGLDLDFHTDENDNPESVTLQLVAEAAIRHQFQGKITCGHCCSLAVQAPETVAKTLDLVKQAGIGIVSLPMCNLYLQDRQPRRTPRWRGVTLIHELKQQGVPVALASDNCRDPFHAFGDHDMLEVFSMSARIAHLDRPYTDWACAVTTTPADLMGLPSVGRIAVGLPANLILFKARNYGELLSRSQRDRVILRHGKAIDTTLPDYRELDDLRGFLPMFSR